MSWKPSKVRFLRGGGEREREINHFKRYRELLEITIEMNNVEVTGYLDKKLVSSAVGENFFAMGSLREWADTSRKHTSTHHFQRLLL